MWRVETSQYELSDQPVHLTPYLLERGKQDNCGGNSLDQTKNANGFAVPVTACYHDRCVGNSSVVTISIPSGIKSATAAISR